MRAEGRVVIVGGIASASTAGRLRAAAGDCSLILAAATSLGEGTWAGPTCLDVTAYLVNFELEVERRNVDDAASAVRRSSPPQGGLVLVREHQLEDDDFVTLLRRLNLAVIPLNTDSCYDYDPSWLVGDFERDVERAQVQYFAVDLYSGYETAWELFQTPTEGDLFNAADLEQICKDFPVILSADFTPGNICAIASFPGARGILLTCDELKPLLPADRHVVSVDAAVELLGVLAAQRK